MKPKDKTIIFTSNAPAPIGPYSQATKVGNLLFISGQLGIYEKKLAETITEQSRYALQNLRSVLEEAGFGPEHVVKTTCFLSDMADFQAFNEVYKETFSTNPPARSCVAVKTLPLNALVEIEAIAVG